LYYAFIQFLIHKIEFFNRLFLLKMIIFVNIILFEGYFDKINCLIDLISSDAKYFQIFFISLVNFLTEDFEFHFDNFILSDPQLLIFKKILDLWAFQHKLFFIFRLFFKLLFIELLELQ
jgi:hypothetical protein